MTQLIPHVSIGQYVGHLYLHIIQTAKSSIKAPRFCFEYPESPSMQPATAQFLRSLEIALSRQSRRLPCSR